MRRRLIAAVLFLPVMMGLCACKGSDSAQKASEEVQKYYGAVSSVSTEYKVVTDYHERVNEFQLTYSQNADTKPTVTVVSPDEISGISAVITDEELNLSYDGASLSIEIPEIKGFTPMEAVPALLSDFSGCVPTEINSEKIDDVDCAALTYEFSENGQSVYKRVWFDQKTLYPVKAEMFLNDELVISLEFLTFNAN